MLQHHSSCIDSQMVNKSVNIKKRITAYDFSFVLARILVNLEFFLNYFKFSLYLKRNPTRSYCLYSGKFL